MGNNLNQLLKYSRELIEIIEDIERADNKELEKHSWRLKRVRDMLNLYITHTREDIAEITGHLKNHL